MTSSRTGFRTRAPTSQNPTSEGKPVRNPSEDGNGIPSKQPSTFGRNTCMNDDEWYHELRARYKMAMSMKAQKERDNYARKKFDNPESKFTILMHGQD